MRIKTFCFLSILAIFGIWLAPSPLVAGKDEGKPVEKSFVGPYDAVWSATIRTLQGRGEPITFTDKENGILTTDYKSDEEDKWRHKFSISLIKKSDGEITVSVTCTVEKRSGSIWAHRRHRWDGKKSDGKREKELLEQIEAKFGSSGDK